MSRILLIIDLQKEFKDQYGMYEKTVNYCTKHYDEYDIVLPTLFCNNYDINANFRDKLNWTGCENVTSNSLAIYPKNSLNSNIVCFESKHGYASKQIFEVADKDKDVIDIVGCDSDACVLATAFKLWDAGYNFRILTDYIYTTAEEYSNEDIIKILKRNFGKCIIER